MKLRALLPLFVALGLPCSLMAQNNPADVLADGDPPLTTQMAGDYMRFMQWSLRTPLTLAQENRLRSFLVDNWKAANKAEISRTLNILALRRQLETMGLQDSRWAAYQTGADALRNWRSDQNVEMARWGLSLFNASHTPLLPGWPTLYRQMEDAYEEMGYFMLSEVNGTKALKIDAVERSQLADSLVRAFPQLTPEQKENFMELPQIWVQVRKAWPTLDDAAKNSLKSAWKAGFYPQPKPSAKPPAKGATAQAPKAQPVINYLVKMTWVTSPEVFSKMKATGTPYGLGW
jgi:hypothetical protein